MKKQQHVLRIKRAVEQTKEDKISEYQQQMTALEEELSSQRQKLEK